MNAMMHVLTPALLDLGRVWVYGGMVSTGRWMWGEGDCSGRIVADVRIRNTDVPRENVAGDEPSQRQVSGGW